MKHLQPKLLCIAAIILALSTAFTTTKLNEESFPLSWRFIGNESDWTQRVDPNYYVADWVFCYPGDNHFCKIIALGLNGKPIIPYPSLLFDYLYNDQEALPQPVVGLVYLKN